MSSLRTAGAPPAKESSAGGAPAVQLQGYAALFGVADLAHDTIRAGAFRASLALKRAIPMLVHHDERLLAGFWSAYEDARGLFVRGRIDPDAPGAARARRLLNEGADGLSIGFIAHVAERQGKGRALMEIELLEVSIVKEPMQPLARFSIVNALPQAA